MSATARRKAAERRSFVIGLGAIGVALAALMFAMTAENGVPGYIPGLGRTEVSAKFATVGALRAGDDVRIANVRAGFVSDIELVDGKPVVHMALDGGREVYDDASVTIGARSALGQKYIELKPGTQSVGRLQGSIPEERTTPAVELDEVLDVFDANTRTQTQTLLRQVGGGLIGRGSDLNDGLRDIDGLLTDVATVSDALAVDNGADLTELLKAAELLASSMAAQEDELSALTGNMATTMDAFAVEQGEPLGEAIEAAPEALRDLRGALNSLDDPLDDTAEAARALRPGIEALADALPDTRGLLREAVPPLRKVPGVSKDAEKAITVLTPLVADARPVVKQLGATVTRAQGPLTTLMPYTPEIVTFFDNFVGALHNNGEGIGWLRLMPAIAPESLGTVIGQTPFTQRNAYPAPGEAATHRTDGTQVSQ